MIKLFRTNTPANYLVAFVIMLALWAYKFIVMPPAVDTGGMHSYFFRLLYESSLYQYIFTILAFSLAIMFACYMAKANFRYQIVDSGYQLPTLFYALLTGILINAQRCIPEMVASLFVSLSVLRLFSTYNRQEAIRECFDAGLLFGISVLLAYRYIYLLPAVIVVMFIVKPVSWRDLASFFVAIGLVAGISLCLVWLYGDWGNMVSSMEQEMQTFVVAEKYNSTNIVFFIPLAYAAIVSLLSVFMLQVSRKTSEMKFHLVMLFLLIYYGALMFSPLLSNESLWLMFFPLCYLLANVVVYSKRRIVSQMVMLGLVLSLVISHIFQMIYYNSIF